MKQKSNGVSISDGTGDTRVWPKRSAGLAGTAPFGGQLPGIPSRGHFFAITRVELISKEGRFRPAVAFVGGVSAIGIAELRVERSNREEKPTELAMRRIVQLVEECLGRRLRCVDDNGKGVRVHLSPTQHNNSPRHTLYKEGESDG